MDKELETVIKILNTRKNQQTVYSHNRSFRIRNTGLGQNSMNHSSKGKNAIMIKPVDNKLHNDKEIVVEEEIISDIQEFYKEEDEEYKKEIVTKKTAALVL